MIPGECCWGKNESSNRSTTPLLLLHLTHQISGISPPRPAYNPQVTRKAHHRRYSTAPPQSSSGSRPAHQSPATVLNQQTTQRGMASTAALLANMQSFDSSDAGQESRAAAGITFGSVAESFHSEEYDQEAQERDQLRRATAAGKGKEREEEFSSIMEEEEMLGNEDDEDGAHDRPFMQQQQQQTRRDASAPARTASSLSAATRTASSQSSRLPSASTAPTDSPRVIPSSLVDMSGPHDSKSEDADSSSMLRNLDMEDSVRSRDIGSWGKTNPIRGAGEGRNGAPEAKRKGAGDSGVPQSLTLREQEKVRLLLIGFGHPCRSRANTSNFRSSTSSRRRISPSSSRFTFTNNDWNASLPTRSTLL